MAVHKVRSRATKWQGSPELRVNEDEAKFFNDLRSTFSQAFGTPQGKKVLDYLNHYVYDQPSFNFLSNNCELEAAYTAGMREVVERIHIMLQGEPK